MPSIANKISTLDVMNLIKRQGALTGVTSGLESGTNQAAGHVKHATKGLSQMQLLAVAIVVAVVVVLSGFGLWWACSYKRNKRKAAQEEEDRRKLVQNQNEQYQTRERTALKRESDWQRF